MTAAGTLSERRVSCMIILPRMRLIGRGSAPPITSSSFSVMLSKPGGRCLGEALCGFAAGFAWSSCGETVCQDDRIPSGYGRTELAPWSTILLGEYPGSAARRNGRGLRRFHPRAY